MKKNLLIIFVRNPELGKVKKKLADTIGEEKALQVYKYLLSRTRNASMNQKVDKAVFYSDFVDFSDEWQNDIFQKHTQKGQEQGEKMTNAFNWGFELGYKRVCILSSDSAEINAAVLKDAFSRLTKNEIVIGPNLNGGYYLLGMNKLHRYLFKNKHWQTNTLFKETIQDINVHNLSACLLSVLTDIEVEKDLKKIDLKVLNVDSINKILSKA